VRKDWLDDLGLKVPVTYDDWEKVLTLFKTEKGAYAPISLGANGYMEYSHALSAGFGVYEDFMQIDGKVVYGPVQEGWKEYLSLLNDWYEKGLIDPNFMINGEWQVDRSMVENGQTGAWNAMYIMMSQYENVDQGMEVIPVTSPVKKEGDELHIRREDCSIGQQPITISANCEHPDIAMKLLDYLFSEEGALLANYGTLNDTFTYDSEGNPKVTGKISNNQIYSMGQAQALYLLPPTRLGGLYDWTRELDAVPEEDLEAYDVWSVGDDSYILPAFLSYNSEESRERSKIVSDVTNYLNDMTIQFVTGVLDINEEWDTYIQTMNDMEIERAIEITQEALNRFNSND
jgi:putative aldouronate transport system substrate-binding protein